MTYNEIKNYYPSIPLEDLNLLKNLPKEFQIDVPFIKQDDKHLSGSAVYQMICEFNNKQYPNQEIIANEAGWNDYTNFNHSTFKENFSHYLIENGIASTHFYPAQFVASKVRDGIIATDIIRGNNEATSEIDFEIIKLYLVKLKRPLKIRLHFTTKHYNMPDEMAKYIDMSGHCALIVGFNEKGFIFNDPWDLSWGGSNGGKDVLYTYYDLMYLYQMVNYTKEDVEPTGTIFAEIPVVKTACLTNNQIVLKTELKWEGVKGYSLKGIKGYKIKAELITTEDLQVVGESTVDILEDLVPGSVLTTEWKLNTGNKPLSHSVKVKYTVEYFYPEIPWENLNSKSKIFIIEAENRVCLFDEQYLRIAGVL